MNNGRAGGQLGVLPELIRCGGEHVLGCLQEVIVRVWEIGSVPADWRSVKSVPILKNGKRHCRRCHRIDKSFLSSIRFYYCY